MIIDCTKANAGGGAGGVDTSGTPVDNDYAKFTDADTIEGRSYAEVRSDLNVEDGADVTDATNVNAAGATMNTDTDVSGNSWVLNEDNMTTASDTKVPTQDSVKNFAETSFFHTSVIYPDDDWDSEQIPLFQPPIAITITKVIATVMGDHADAELTFNIEPRTNVNTANSTDELFAADQDADKDGLSLTSFVSGKDAITAEDHLVLTTPASAEAQVVDCLIISIYYDRT